MSNGKVVTPSTNLQKAVVWIAEVILQDSDKNRDKVLKDAQIRFDLTPVECEFLSDKFADRDAQNNG